MVRLPYLLYSRQIYVGWSIPRMELCNKIYIFTVPMWAVCNLTLSSIQMLEHWDRAMNWSGAASCFGSRFFLLLYMSSILPNFRLTLKLFPTTFLAVPLHIHLFPLSFLELPSGQWIHSTWTSFLLVRNISVLYLTF